MAFRKIDNIFPLQPLPLPKAPCEKQTPQIRSRSRRNCCPALNVQTRALWTSERPGEGRAAASRRGVGPGRIGPAERRAERGEARRWDARKVRSVAKASRLGFDLTPLDGQLPGCPGDSGAKGNEKTSTKEQNS
ncbi:uncharacterized protein LOC128929027 isoform X2 [Callithrix jacchus]